ncbi:gluconokinase [Pedobacter sp. CG_S7]|uniref:gluconokinase n=1 Tax=Pedobacter sp. CG_S7 TaxID=3143930 RepID=UPI0033984868
MEYVVGIDIGTGSVKAVAVTQAGKSFEVSQHHYSFKAPEPGYHEQNPEDIWAAFVLSLEHLLQRIGHSPNAICLSSAMHSLIAVNESGKALAPMITWADNRASAIAQNLRTSPEGLAIYKATGTPLHAMSPLCKLIWIRENNPELFQKTHRFISIKEYIWHKLFKEFQVDHSIASCTGLFAIDELTWHEKALELAGITAERLSTPVPNNYNRKFKGHSAINFLTKGTPVFIGASDGCLANLGSMANKPGVAVMTIGTSGAIRVASNTPLPNEKAMTFSYILDEETFICGGPINNGGLALQWWLKNMNDMTLTDNVYKQFFQSVKEVPAGSKGLLFLPYLTGERAPIWDSESCGAFFGVKLQHERKHFSRAVIEGICYAMRNVLEALEENATPITHIHISGGFVKSKVWVQILADITGKNLVLVQTDDASAVGAAFLAMKSLGILEDYPIANLSELKIVVPNSSNTLVYSQNFNIFKKLYADLKDTMHQLHQLN